MVKRIALVSCVKTKQKSAAVAEDLYISALFRSMRKYAEKNADEWFILSAQHGLLRPDQVIAPYERTLITMAKPDRLAWAAKVQKQLLKVLPPKANVIILAGERYREYIEPFLTAQGFEVTVPMNKMKFGTQLRWLKEQTR
jgi:hypothetical protein